MHKNEKTIDGFDAKLVARYRTGNWCRLVQGFLAQPLCDQVADPRLPACSDCPRRRVCEC